MLSPNAPSDAKIIVPIIANVKPIKAPIIGLKGRRMKEIILRAINIPNSIFTNRELNYALPTSNAVEALIDPVESYSSTAISKASPTSIT